MVTIMGNVPVDTGSFVIIDPCYLFTGAEWRQMMRRKATLTEAGVDEDEAYRKVIFDAIHKRGSVSAEVKADELGALVTGFGGDGVYRVEETSRGGVEVVL